MAFSVHHLWGLVTFSAYAAVQGQFLKCGFGRSCPGFTESIDNFYNTDTDVPWERVSQLQLTNYKALEDDKFLAIYQPPPGENPQPTTNMTARITLPSPEHSESDGLGCLRIRYALDNGTMYLTDFETGRTKFSTTSNSSQMVNGMTSSMSAITEDMGKTMIVVELWPGMRAEFGLDYVKMYRENCTVVSDYDDEEFPAPTWPARTTPAPTTVTPAPDKVETTTRGTATTVGVSLSLLVASFAALLLHE